MIYDFICILLLNYIIIDIKDKREVNMSKEYLGKIVDVNIDRPMGSRHPKHGFIYPVNYGYIPNTVSGDGEELHV